MTKCSNHRELWSKFYDRNQLTFYFCITIPLVDIWVLYISGFCGAPLWSAKCSYVTSSGIKYSKAKKIDEDNTVTNFFGLFFLIFQTGQIWGNLISSQVLKPSGKSFTKSYSWTNFKWTVFKVPLWIKNSLVTILRFSNCYVFSISI